MVDSTGIEDVGDVLRLLGADDSITGQLWYTSDHREHYSRSSTRLGGCDACQCEVSQRLRVPGACFWELSGGNFPKLGHCLLWGQGGGPHNLQSSDQSILHDP